MQKCNQSDFGVDYLWMSTCVSPLALSRSHYLQQRSITLCASFLASCVRGRKFSLWLVGGGAPPDPVWARHCSLVPPSGAFSALDSFPSHVQLDRKGPLRTAAVLSLSISLGFSFVSFSSPSSVLNSQFHLLSFGNPSDFAWISSSVPQPEISLKTVLWN